jgi:single-strand DNA-binding protein
MSNVNTCTISGNLTADPESRAAGDSTVTSFRVASSHSWRLADGSGYGEKVTFVTVQAWGGFGELLAKKLRKGDRVTVAGRLQSREWEDKEGQRRFALDLVADAVDGDAMYRAAGQEPARQPEKAAAFAGQGDDIPF